MNGFESTKRGFIDANQDGICDNRGSNQGAQKNAGKNFINFANNKACLPISRFLMPLMMGGSSSWSLQKHLLFST